ncbi:unnamed protein product [Rhizophagus irregularis]|nr:unnamed protein product [Rhizophagus irregularis]
MISSTSARDNNNKRKNDNDIKNTKKTKKGTSDNNNIKKNKKVTDKLNTNVFNVSFALWSILKETNIKTFTMNVETGLMQYTKSDGILHVRSVRKDEKPEISGLELNILTKSVKLLNTTAELVAKDIYRLLQCIEKLPENPLTRDNLIFKHSGNYRNRLIDYLNFINHKDEFSIFKGAFAVELHKNEKTPSGTPTSIIEIVTNNDFETDKRERISMLKAAINSLSAHVWHSINSLIKDSISQKLLEDISSGSLFPWCNLTEHWNYFVH